MGGGGIQFTLKSDSTARNSTATYTALDYHQHPIVCVKCKKPQNTIFWTVFSTQLRETNYLINLKESLRGNTLKTTAKRNSYKSYFKVKNQKSMKNTATTNSSSSMSKTSSSKLKDLSSNPGINISLYRSPSTNNPSAVPNAKI